MPSTLFLHIITMLAFNFFNVTQATVFDNLTSSISLSPIAHSRIKREPAVWGDAAPDYSLVALDGTTTYIYALLFVDSKITDYYKEDMIKVKKEVTKMVKESNEYLYQLNIRIQVVDILPTMRSDLSLYSFEDYYNQRLNLLPYHNFAALISYRYGGGLAFVSGMCSNKPVMLAGFYPHNPIAMGGIFFHELAHLLGVPHQHPNETLNVTNCACPKITEEMYSRLSSGERKTGCLKIPGFDHDCTVQLMANYLYRNRCLSRTHRTNEQNIKEGFVEWAVDNSLTSICGNGILEGHEQCDCGLEKFCTAWNCDAKLCTNYIPKWILVLVIVVICVLLLLIGILYIYIRCCKSSSINKFGFNVPKMDIKPKPTRVLRALAEPLYFLKRLIFRQKNRNHRRPKNLVNSKRPIFLSNAKLDPASIIVVRSCSNENMSQAKIQRPKIPPPPPPLSTNTLSKVSRHVRPARPPPPVFSAFKKSPNNQDYEAPKSSLLDSIQSKLRNPMEVLVDSCSEDRFSISRKFEDFDDDYD